MKRTLRDGGIALAHKKKPERQVWRIWVDTRRRLVSFHEAPDCQLLEFYSYELFQSCLDGYTAQRYRYQ